MCVKPLQIYRFNPVLNASTLDTVPCGRCIECRNIKRSQFAAQSVIEAKKYGRLFFATFTYDNNCIPLSLTARRIVGGEIVHLYESRPIDEQYREKYISLMVDAYRRSPRYRPEPRYQNSLEPINFPIFQFDDDDLIDVQVTPSLNRESFRLWLKAFRMRYLRSCGKLFPMTFKYTFFGEYGDWSSRPHFHAILTGLDSNQMYLLAKDFKEHFGNCDYYQVNEVNPDGSPGFIKSAKYVSKYSYKDKLSLSADLAGYVEKPRKCSSRNFGWLSKNDLKKYREYFLGFDYYRYNPDYPLIPDDKKETLFKIICERKHKFIIDGCKFSTPDWLIRECFYTKLDGAINKEEIREYESNPVGRRPKVRFIGRSRYTYRPKKIQKLVTDFARSQNIALFGRQLQEYANVFGQNFRLAAQELSNTEFCLLDDRETRAQAYYLNSLKHQVYA